MTDSKGRSARRGWVFFDRDCRQCLAMARTFQRILGRRGFGLAALQDPRVAAQLRLSPEELLTEMRVLTADGTIYGGADGIIFLARQIWWAWPLYGAAQLPGARSLFRRSYRWFAEHRSCAGGRCSLPSPRLETYKSSKGESE